jgi:hypothetical protein
MNIKCCHNHEERKTNPFTCKKQNITKTKNTTNEEHEHPSCLTMINCFSCSHDYLLFWHFLSIQNLKSSSSTRSLLHPNFHLDLVHTKKTLDTSLGHNDSNHSQSMQFVFLTNALGVGEISH